MSKKSSGKKRGRPTKYAEAMKDYRMRLAAQHAETFRKAGEGNMSAGGRRLADDWEDRNMNKKGMTLVELLIVVGIAAILAAMALTVYSRCREPGENEAGRERCRQIYLQALMEEPDTIALRQALMSGRIYYQIPRNERHYDSDYGGEFADGPERHLAWYMYKTQEEITWDEERIRR